MPVISKLSLLLGWILSWKDSHSRYWLVPITQVQRPILSSSLISPWYLQLVNNTLLLKFCSSGFLQFNFIGTNIIFLLVDNSHRPKAHLICLYGLLWRLRRWRICLQWGRPGFDPWIEKMLWRRARQPTSVFLPGASPWAEEPGGLQSVGSQGVGRHWATKHSTVCLYGFSSYCFWLLLSANSPHQIIPNNVCLSLLSVSP